MNYILTVYEGFSTGFLVKEGSNGKKSCNICSKQVKMDYVRKIDFKYLEEFKVEIIGYDNLYCKNCRLRNKEENFCFRAENDIEAIKTAKSYIVARRI